MKVDFRKPRLALPLIIFPFLVIFFYTYKSLNRTSGGPENQVAQAAGDSLQGKLAEVSNQVKSEPLSSKLSAYKQQYREADGYTAIKQLEADKLEQHRFDDLYTQQEKRRLDSLEQTLKRQRALARVDPANATNTVDPQWNNHNEEQDIAVQQALAALVQPAESKLTEKEPVVKSDEPTPPDPMELFRMQMAYADSMAKANDPEIQKQIQERRQVQRQQSTDSAILAVSKYDSAALEFNTLRAEQQDTPIQAIIDQSITGRIDSRIRIRLLDDMRVGSQQIKRGTYLYARMSGFSAQRVMLTVTSILKGSTILPVRLEIYDNDGSQGLYVPASAFREFSKELGSNSAQGITLQQTAGNSQMVMGTLQRMFQSTSSAVAKQIRKNKAKLKYKTLVYLIDQRTQH